MSFVLKSGSLSLLEPYLYSCFSSPHNFSSPFFTWFSHLCLILYRSLPKFLNSLTMLTVSIVPSAISSLIFDYLCLSISSVHLCFSAHFNNTWNSMGLAVLLSPQGTSTPVTLLSFQSLSKNKFMPVSVSPNHSLNYKTVMVLFLGSG